MFQERIEKIFLGGGVEMAHRLGAGKPCTSEIGLVSGGGASDRRLAFRPFSMSAKVRSGMAVWQLGLHEPGIVGKRIVAGVEGGEQPSGRPVEFTGLLHQEASLKGPQRLARRLADFAGRIGLTRIAEVG